MAGPGPGGTFTALDQNAAAVIKDSPGLLFTVVVVTAGSTSGSVYDSTSTSGNTAANQIGTIPATVGSYPFYGFPCKNGIVYEPGSGQVAAIAYS